jgi:hypothetical protein
MGSAGMGPVGVSGGLSLSLGAREALAMAGLGAHAVALAARGFTDLALMTEDLLDDGTLEQAGVRRDPHVGRGPHGRDRAILDEHDPVGDRWPGHRVHDPAADGQRRRGLGGRGGRAAGSSQEEGEAEQCARA